MRKIVFVMLLAPFVLLTYQLLLANSGATIAPLGSQWHSPEPLAKPLGKVIYNIPDKRNRVNLTYIIEGGAPTADYNVGFDIKSGTGNCLDLPATFGVGRAAVPCFTENGCAGTLSPVASTACRSDYAHYETLTIP